MAIPRVFVSSTCYDLRYVRENLEFFIGNMGFEPVLSEAGSVFYDPTKHVQDACLAEVSNCQMLVLIIGGRFGSKYKDKNESIVNHEYREAVNKKIPVFAMVEQQVHAEYRVYQTNKENKSLDASKITYPAVDSTKIFEFMEEVQGKAINNALVPFSDYGELESYLQQQWAGMMYNFLTHKSESERVTSTLEALTSISNKIEFLSKQILSSVGRDIEKLNLELYELMSSSELNQSRFRINMSPAEIIRSEDFDEFSKGKGILVNRPRGKMTMGSIIDDNEHMLYMVDKREFERLDSLYEKLREKLLNRLKQEGMKPDAFLKELQQRSLA